MAYEHHDSERTHLFEQAAFNGSFAGRNTVHQRTSPDTWLTPYNVVYQGEDSIFLFGGGYGDRGGTGAFVARVDPVTLKKPFGRPS